MLSILIKLANQLDAINSDAADEVDLLIDKIAAEYQGKEVKLNDPIRNPSGSKKKFRVYVRDPKTKKVKKIEFGDPNMEIRRDDPEARKSFRARHKCDKPEGKDKMTARYWSCYQWRNSNKVDN